VLIVEQSKPGAVSGGKYARFHCLGMCLRYSESDELTNYRNQIEQAHRSIHTDISRNRHPCSEIWDSESRKNIAFENCSLNMVRWGIRKRTALEFPCLSPDRWRSCWWAETSARRVRWISHKTGKYRAWDRMRSYETAWRANMS